VHGFAIVGAVFPKRVDNREKLAYEGRFRIESTAPWVRAGQSVFVVNGNNSGFDVLVDPTQLESGCIGRRSVGLKRAMKTWGQRSECQ
jgi:hypothetical protein